MSVYRETIKVKNKRNRRLKWCVRILFLLALVMVVLLAKGCIEEQRDKRVSEKLQKVDGPDFAQQEILDENCNSRNGKKLETVRNVVIHYVGNPGTSAINNRDYFAKDDTVVNSHFVVGLDGEVIQCLPLYEQSVSSNWRNPDIISIEVCHPDETGEFNEDTMESLIKLTAWLCKEFELDADDVIRHYDVTGKLCPLYYVEHEDAWEEFLEKVDKEL